MPNTADDELDLHALGRAIWRRKWLIFIPALVAAIVAGIAVQFVAPKYRSEARVLYEGRENIFLRPDAERQLDRSVVDQEAVASQVQLLYSQDLARQVVKKLKLGEQAEFDPVLNGVSPLSVMLGILGIGKDPLQMTPEERVLAAYFQRINVYAVEKSRVIGVTFDSVNPELAARVANTVAETYLSFQQNAKQLQAREASEWLAGEIESLRKKVTEAEAKVEQYRAKANLFVGTNNTTLSNQQLAEFNSQLAAARAQKADAEVRARLIRGMLRSGKPIESTEIINSELMRRLAEQRAGVQAQLAEQSSTLLGGHPRIKELRAQVADLDRVIRQEADRLARALENDARIASARVESLSANLDVLKRQAAATNEHDVQLRGLEREAKAQRDLLASYLAKYREATARDSIASAPGDARIISRATVSNIPAYPKKLPIVLITALAVMVLAMSFVATSELLSGHHSRRLAMAGDAPMPSWQPGIGARDAVSVPDLTIDDLARSLRESGPNARRVMVMGAARNVGTTRTAMALARTLARDAKVVLVDLALATPNLAAVAADPAGPGLAELVRGTASFGDILNRDKHSQAHVVTVGKDGDADAIMASPLLATALGALAQTYDHVVMDAGALRDAPLDRLAQLAERVVLVAGEASARTIEAAQAQLLSAGFVEVAVLTGAPPSDAAEAATRAAA